jgi:hypothetical protein
METFDLTGVMKREYLIKNLPWLTSYAAGTGITEIDLPDDLFLQPFIADKIKDFIWFRGGVRITVRIVTNPFLYGKLLVSYHPRPTNIPAAMLNDVPWLSSLPHIVVSAAASEAAIFDIPFISEYRAISTVQIMTAIMGAVRVNVLNPLININGDVDSAKIMVYAQFLEPELFMPFTLNSGTPEPLKITDSHIQLPSQIFTEEEVEDFEKEYPDISWTREDLDDFKSYLKSKKLLSPFPEVKPEPVSEILSNNPEVNFPSLNQYDFWKNFSLETQSKHLPPKPNSKGAPAKEAHAKSTSGSISSSLEAAASVSSVLSSVPFVGPYAALATGGLSLAGGAAKMLGLDKPTTLNNTQVIKVDPHWHINYGSGLDLAPKASTFPECAITTTPNVGGQTADEMDLHYIAGTPTLVAIVGLTPTSGTVIIARSNINEYCYCDTVAGLFKYWSGSIKIKCYITASKFHSVRLVFWLSENDATAIRTDWQECYHEFVDVQNDTEFETLLPWMDNMLQKKFNTNNKQFSLMCTVLSWSQPKDELNTPIYLNIYKAADADFQWAQYCEKWLEVQSNPRADFAKPFRPMHPSMSAFHHEKLVCGEAYSSLRELLHKTTNYYGPTTDFDLTTYQHQPVVMSGHKYYFGVEMLMNLFFLFWRGSIRMRFMRNEITPTTKSMFYVDDSSNVIHGTSIACINNTALEMEAPYFYDTMFRFCRPDNNTDVNIKAQVAHLLTSGGLAATFMQKSAGDDFSGMFLCLAYPGETLASVPLSTTTYQVGNPGLAKFLN